MYFIIGRYFQEISILGGNSSDNQSVVNLSESLPDETLHESITNRSIDIPPSQDTSNETTTTTTAPTTVVELTNSLDTTDETPSSSSSSSSSITESIQMDYNVTEPLIETNTIEETMTTTAPVMLNNHNHNEVAPPIISSPWIKGMLVNSKSLPELFKIIEKLSFNLTLSNRYLQELSQHYV